MSTIHGISKLIHLKKDSADGVTALFLNTTLRTLAFSLIGIFLPVFIFVETQKVFGESIEIGLYGVVSYYFLMRVTVVISLIPASKVISKYGFRWSMLTSSTLMILFLILLSFSRDNLYIILLASIVHGVQSAFYWLSYRSLFVKDGTMSHLGSNVGTASILAQFAGISGPVLGGVIISMFGFQYLFLTALVVVIFSSIPFFFIKHHTKNKAASIKSVITWLKEKRHRNEEISFFGRRIDDFIISIFWPIYAFIVVEAYDKQGLAASLGLIASTVVIYIAGKVFDKKHSHSIYKFGVWSTSILWLLKAFVRSFQQLISVEVAVNILSPFYWVTYDSLLYERARDDGDQVLTFMVSRMIMVSVSLFVILLFVFLIAKFEFRFYLIFALASLGTLITNFMWEDESEKISK